MLFAGFQRIRCSSTLFFAVLLFLIAGIAHAQSNSGIVQGTVTDPSKAAIPGAKVRLENPVSGHVDETTTDTTGAFRIANIPFNPYHLSVSADGFNTATQDVDVRSTLPISLEIGLQIGTSTTNVTVTESAVDLLEEDSSYHTDVDRGLFDKLPLESASSSVSSLVTLSSPGISADSNGLFHGLGDHAENSFSVDGQPITDQQSKVFSNQIPEDAIESMEVIDGAPAAEYGDKTSVVINVTTRSGLSVKQPTGSITGSFGSFHTANAGVNLAIGGDKWGEFITASGLNSNRFLDPPEVTVFHDNGNEENIFDRFDYKLSAADTISANFQYTRSWFQNPDAFDNLNVGAVDRNGNLVGRTDQRSQIKTFDIAPTWTHLIGSSVVVEAGAWVRRDVYNYYPSKNPFADFASGIGRDPATGDLAPVSVESETVSQRRTLLSTGGRGAVSYVKGRHNFKAGLQVMVTPLTENFGIGVVDPSFNPVCDNADGSIDTDPRVTSQAQCGTALNPGGSADAAFNPILGCNDLTRSSAAFPLPASDGCPAGQTVSGLFNFHGHRVIDEVAPYAQDTITVGGFSFNLGFRYDVYRGLSNASLPEPRLGVAYKVGPSNTVLRFSYARTMETPFNENLLLSSTGCSANFPALVPLLPGCDPTVSGVIVPGKRNEFHAGLEQAFGKYFVLDGEYIWKYTTGAYDFSTLGSTPITFPIEWSKSKIPGFAIRGSMPNFHGLSAFVVMSSVAARFFNPQIGGAGNVPPGPATGAVFRIDHDEKFNETTHAQYQLPFKNSPWIGFNWRYDSGLVAGQTPCYGIGVANTCPQSDPIIPNTIDMVQNDGSTPLTADQEFQAGFFCGSIHATPTTPLPFTCPAASFGSTLITVPKPGTENDDHNPPRIAPRNLFDLAIGDDNLFHGDRYKWSARLTIVNLTNKVALYNFLSTFSGTHYVTPRTFSVDVGFHF
jgi:hypothetical protein